MRIEEIDKNMKIETDITEPDLIWLDAKQAPTARSNPRHPAVCRWMTAAGKPWDHLPSRFLAWKPLGHSPPTRSQTLWQHSWHELVELLMQDSGFWRSTVLTDTCCMNSYPR